MIMSRAKKESKRLNINLAGEIHEKLEKYCEESGMSKTMATERIFGNFFDEYFQRPEEERKKL